MGILLYILVGMGMLLLTFIIHIIIADLKGYDAMQWWEKHTTFISWRISISDLFIILGGWALWPVSIALFILCRKEFYKNYRRQDGR